jgi:hypothetical protein
VAHHHTGVRPALIGANSSGASQYQRERHHNQRQSAHLRCPSRSSIGNKRRDRAPAYMSWREHSPDGSLHCLTNLEDNRGHRASHSEVKLVRQMAATLNPNVNYYLASLPKSSRNLAALGCQRNQTNSPPHMRTSIYSFQSVPVSPPLLSPRRPTVFRPWTV